MFMGLLPNITRFSLTVLVSMILGIMVVILPAKLLFALLIVLALFILVFLNPWMIFVITLGLVSGLDLPGFFPQLGFLGGKVKLPDLFLLLSVFFIFLFFWTDFTSNIKALKPITVPSFLYVFIVFISCFIAYLFFDTSIKHVLGELRHQLYWLLLPLFAVLTVDNDRYKKIIVFMIILGLLASFLQLLQGAGGVKLSASAKELTTMGEVSGVIRTNIGIFLIAWSFFLFTAAHLLGYLSFTKFIIPFLINALGILLTYTKSFWAGVFIGFFLLIRKFEFKSQASSMIKFSLIALFSLLLIVLVKPQLFYSLIDRVSVIGEEVESGYSLQWRAFENERAIESIKSYPLGIGIGSVYRESTVVDRDVADMVRYIHNSYLYIWVKLGVLALILVLIIFYKSIKYSIGCYVYVRAGKAESWDEKLDVLVFITYPSILIGVLVYSIFTPSIMVDGGIAFLAAITGIVLGRGLNIEKRKVLKFKLSDDMQKKINQ